MADPSAFEMQKKVNLKIKKREAFRPFAPAILEEDAIDFFDIQSGDNYKIIFESKYIENKFIGVGNMCLPMAENEKLI